MHLRMKRDSAEQHEGKGGNRGTMAASACGPSTSCTTMGAIFASPRLGRTERKTGQPTGQNESHPVQGRLSVRGDWLGTAWLKYPVVPLTFQLHASIEANVRPQKRLSAYQLNRPKLYGDSTKAHREPTAAVLVLRCRVAITSQIAAVALRHERGTGFERSFASA